MRRFRTGKFFDDITGLYYNQARWYDPTLGRFISESPIAPFAEEDYAYCGNDPVNFVDENGYEKKSINEILGDKISDFFGNLFDKTLRPILNNLIPQNRPNTPPELFSECSTIDDDLSDLSHIVSNELMLSIENRFPLLGILGGAVKVNNPWGRRGSPEHQARIAEIERRFNEKGWKTVSGGSKREQKFGDIYPDIVLQKGNKTIVFQVGRTTLSGRPVWRERHALNALRESRKFNKVWFLRY